MSNNVSCRLFAAALVACGTAACSLKCRFFEEAAEKDVNGAVVCFDFGTNDKGAWVWENDPTGTNTAGTQTNPVPCVLYPDECCSSACSKLPHEAIYEADACDGSGQQANIALYDCQPREPG